MKSLGIFGGTFAPVHRGHTAAARAFIEGNLADELRIIPTGISPHKTMQDKDVPADRLAMLKAAFADLTEEFPGRIIIDPYETEKSGKSYTILTVEHYMPDYDSITLLCGADMFLSLESWYRGEELLTICSFAYDSRKAQDRPALDSKAEYYKEKYGTKCTPLNKDTLDISSTEIRDMISRGLDTGKYLHPAVIKYINEHRLYRI